MSIEREEAGGIVLLKAPGRLDVQTAPSLTTAVEEVFETPGQRLLIDMSGVTYLGSMGIRALVQGAQIARARGGRVVLAGLQGTAREAFDIAGLDRAIDLHDSSEEALASSKGIPPRPASGSEALDTDLSLPEEILLLKLDDEDGHFVNLSEHALHFAAPRTLYSRVSDASR